MKKTYEAAKLELLLAEDELLNSDVTASGDIVLPDDDFGGGNGDIILPDDEF